MQIKKVVFLLLSLFAIPRTSLAQDTPDPFCNDSSYRALLRVAGETINVSCDTIYLLNKATFHLLHASYLEYQQQSNSLSSFYDSVDQFLSIYKEHAEDQRREFDTLGIYYHQLSDSSKLLVNNANKKLQSINTNLDSIQHSISLAQTNLTDVQEMVKKSEKKKWLFGAVGGAIGFGVGFILATTLVLLATN